MATFTISKGETRLITPVKTSDGLYTFTPDEVYQDYIIFQRGIFGEVPLHDKVEQPDGNILLTYTEDRKSIKS